MKIMRFALTAVLWIGLFEATQATNRYVALTGTNDAANGYTNWLGAATNIQFAIDACSSGDLVLVSNGVYDVSGTVPAGTTLTNRVAITNAITLQSVNGPTVTIIKGARDPTTTNGPAAVRCVYMTNGATLIGFTLTNGATLATGSDNDQYGGGVWSPSTDTVISNCVLASNSAALYGGGAYGGTLYNCTNINNSAFGSGGGAYGSILSNCMLSGNSATTNGGGVYAGTLYNCTLSCNSATTNGGGAYASALYNCILTSNSAALYGGGAYSSILYNCTVASNTATSEGGGVYGGTSVNSIVYFNTAANNSNWASTVSFTNSCTTPTNDVWSIGNITNDPMFIDKGTGNYRLSAGSQCINTGTNQSWMTNSFDLDELPRILQSTVDMGAYESAYLLSVSPLTFTNTVMSGSSTNMNISLVNTSPETQVCWQATITSAWVQGATSGERIETNSTSTLTVTNSSLALSLGTHISRMTFVSPTNISTVMLRYPQTGTVDMTMHVAEFGRSPTQMTATVKQFGATSDTVRIWNTGAGELSYTVSTNVPWLAVYPVGGVLTGQTDGATNTLNVVFTNTFLSVGTHNGADAGSQRHRRPFPRHKCCPDGNNRAANDGQSAESDRDSNDGTEFGQPDNMCFKRKRLGTTWLWRGGKQLMADGQSNKRRSGGADTNQSDRNLSDLVADN